MTEKSQQCGQKPILQMRNQELEIAKNFSKFSAAHIGLTVRNTKKCMYKYNLKFHVLTFLILQSIFKININLFKTMTLFFNYSKMNGHFWNSFHRFTSLFFSSLSSL